MQDSPQILAPGAPMRRSAIIYLPEPRVNWLVRARTSLRLSNG
jgi:hypothetical protein